MIKLLIPKSKGKLKTNIRGFWYNQKNKKTYYDYSTILELPYINYDFLDTIKKIYKQKALFLINNNKAIIYYDKNNQEVLTKKINISINNKKDLKRNIKKMLDKYNGLTVYIKNKIYLLEVWLKERTI